MNETSPKQRLINAIMRMVPEDARHVEAEFSYRSEIGPELNSLQEQLAIDFSHVEITRDEVGHYYKSERVVPAFGSPKYRFTTRTF